MTTVRSVALAGAFTLWALVALWPGAKEATPPATTTTTTVRLHMVATSTTTTTTTVAAVDPPTTTSTVPVSERALCPQWWQTAYLVGWPLEELPHLDDIIWRESRCLADAHRVGPRDDSYGLLQINMLGYLRNPRMAQCNLAFPAELYFPATNLSCALTLWQSSGWAPWTIVKPNATSATASTKP